MSNPPPVETFKDLIAWKKGFALCKLVYGVTGRFPFHERPGISFEMRKTVRSIISNIAEGQRRKSTVEYVRFLDIARGSQAELQTQLMLAAELGYMENGQRSEAIALCEDVGRLIFRLMQALKSRSGKAQDDTRPGLPPHSAP